MQRITSGKGVTDLGTATGEGKALEERSLDKHLKDVDEETMTNGSLYDEFADRQDAEAEQILEAVDQEVVRRRGNSAEYDIEPVVYWVLKKLAEDFGELGVAKAAAFLAGHHVEPGFGF